MALWTALKDLVRGRPPRDLAPFSDDTTFRRAVGLQLRLRPCAGLNIVHFTASRHGGETRSTLGLDDAASLMALTRWSTAAQCGLPPSLLKRWVEDNLAFFSPEQPAQQLSEPHPSSHGHPALRRNVWPTPVLLHQEELQPFPFMPRTASLDGATLAGMHFGIMELGTQVCGIGFSCCEAHGMELRDLVSHLDGRSEVEPTPLFSALDALGLIERFSPPPVDKNATQVTWLGHACVLLETCGKRILVDPLFHPCSEPARDVVTPPDPRMLGPLDAILITHGDNDHLNPQALARLPKNTPLFLPKAPSSQPYHVDMNALTSLLGFTRVTWTEPWQRVTLGDVVIVAAPFRGEDWGLSLPTLTWLVHSKPLTVYLGADAAPMPEVYARLSSEFAIDLAMLGVSGCQEAHVMPPGFGYGNFYAPWIPAERRNQWVALCSGPSDAAEAARTLRTRFAFGYAAGGAPFIPLAYTDRGSHADIAALLSSTDGPKPLGLMLGIPTPVR